MIYSLPIPPSTNNLFKSVATRGRSGKIVIRRARAEAYDAWITEATIALIRQERKKVAGKVNIWMSVPRNNRRDLDGHIKPILDLLVKRDLIDDDRNVETIFAYWSVSGQDVVIVTVEPAGPVAMGAAS